MSASLRDVIVKLNPPVPPLRTNLANPLQKRLNLVVLFPEAREAVPLIDIDTGKKIGNIHHGCRSALGEHLRKSFSANEIAGQTVSQISAISVVTHVRRDRGAKVCRARRFALEEFHCDGRRPGTSVTGGLGFAGQVKYRSCLSKTERSQRNRGRFRRRDLGRATNCFLRQPACCSCSDKFCQRDESSNARTKENCRSLASLGMTIAEWREADYRPRTVTSSRTEAADLSSAAFSSAVSLISMICSMPRAPSFTGTPTNRPVMPYSPSR